MAVTIGTMTTTIATSMVTMATAAATIATAIVALIWQLIIVQLAANNPVFIVLFALSSP